MPKDGPACPCDASAQAGAARSTPTGHPSTTQIASCSCSKFSKPPASLRSHLLETESIYETRSRKLGRVFEPALVCDSIGQCVAAVETGVFAAVLPVHIKPSPSGSDYVVVEDDSLDPLKRKIALVWHPRTADVMGRSGARTRQTLLDALIQQGAQS